MRLISWTLQSGSEQFFPIVYLMEFCVCVYFVGFTYINPNHDGV